METPPPPPAAVDYSSNVDTSRAFRSVKEAVAVFGERFLTGEIFLPPPKPPFTLPIIQETPPWKSPHTSWKSCSSSRESREDQPPSLVLVASMKKIQSELEETKKELELLKERGSETEVALASLNAELRKNVPKIGKSDEPAVAEKVVALGLDVVVSGGGGRKTVERKNLKKKPIIPLLRDLFSKRKRKANAGFVNPLYTSSSRMRWISKLGFN